MTRIEAANTFTPTTTSVLAVAEELGQKNDRDDDYHFIVGVCDSSMHVYVQGAHHYSGKYNSRESQLLCPITLIVYSYNI